MTDNKTSVPKVEASRVMESSQVVTLGIASEIFAVPVTRVREILDLKPISQLPYAPAHLLGIIDVRGQGVPVIDLRLKLRLPDMEDTHDTRIIVLTTTVKGREQLLGLKADRVFEVTELDEPDLKAPREFGMGWSPSAIAGVGRRNGAFVSVLDLECMFATEDLPEMGDMPTSVDAA